ncbi:MAG TPA: tRNA (N6-threonylcarbamoyladenosine(37)-N6)-methyltransferase TrmO [Dehalococcoidales bacterium]|nr:tRNA (N6-threonylcarbamoyladenosine(37)-N6)-methyltransferase TrmO [Dehalococcoidales bacterium]
MNKESPGMFLKAIGFVRNRLKELPNRDFDYKKVVSEIVIDSSLTEALDRLDEFSHIIVLYWMHKAVTSQLRTKVHVRGKQELPLVGLFATRSPHRPNPIGMTTVRLLERQGNILQVEGLDAIDGTPVVDIKPYIPRGDSPTDARVPQWITSQQSTSRMLINIYHQLMTHYGTQHWWPAREPFEVIVGAILTQSAAWTNVAKAIANLKSANALSPVALRQLPQHEVADLIHPCGYYNAKALKLKSLVNWLGKNYNDDLDKLFNNDIDLLRQQLLSIHGIGEETADSIILYAAHKPIFVIDAYTRRIISRIGLISENSYAAYQTLFMDNLPTDTRLFNEYHALLVRLAKDACRKRPLCQQCCLNNLCQFYIGGRLEKD